jgi:ABC-type transport system substrate-binding protein
VQLAEILQAQLAEVGIDVTLRQVDTAQVSEIFYGAQQGDSILAAWGGRPDPSQTAGLLFTPGSLQNPGAHSTEEVQRLHQLSLEPVSEEERTKRVRALSAQIVEDALDVPVYFPDAVYVSTDDVVGLQIWIGGKPEFRGVGMRAG